MIACCTGQSEGRLVGAAFCLLGQIKARPTCKESINRAVVNMRRSNRAGPYRYRLRAIPAIVAPYPCSPTGNQVRAFWKTLLLYALVGPLIGLFALLVVSAVVAEWESITHAVGVLTARAHRPPCEPPHDGIFDLRCFQREEPLHLWPTEIGAPSLKILSLYVFGAYAIGFIPAALAGFLVGGIRLSDNKFGLRQAVLVGTLIGLTTGAVAVAQGSPGMAMRALGVAALLLFLCLFSTVVCWRLTDRWWRGA